MLIIELKGSESFNENDRLGQIAADRTNTQTK